MSSICESCMSWSNHYYWNHMSDEKKQFFSVASGDFKNSMRISQEFATHLRSWISETIELKAPNGNIYHIGVCREMGELVLRSGWDVFVTAHHIEENDSFLFRYRGNSSFEVCIFNSRGCEKASSCFQLPSEIFGAAPPTCDHHVPNEKVAPKQGHAHSSTDFDYIMSSGCRLTKAQDEKVVEIAHTLRSEIPLYVAVMDKNNVNLKDCFINIPLTILDHFKEEIAAATIKLEAPDCNIYNVGASKHSDDQALLQSGWAAFVVAHHIQENDLLIFRSKGKTRLEVLILDSTGCPKDFPCFPSTEETCEEPVEITDPPPRVVIDLSSSDDDHIVGEDTRKSCMLKKQALGRCAKTRKMASTSSPSTKSGMKTRKSNDLAYVETAVDPEPLISNILRGPSWPPYILAQGVTLTKIAQKKVQEKVQAIRSKLPIYVAVMTKSSVGGQLFSLAFCKEYGSAYLPVRDQTLILQLEDKMEWHTTLHIPKRKVKIIHRGWPEFASDNHLRLGDICLFQLAKVKMESLTMTVHFIRKPDM